MNYDSFIFWDALQNNCSFIKMRYSILNLTWNIFATWNDFFGGLFVGPDFFGFLKKWSFDKSDLFSMTSSELSLKNPTLPGMKNHNPEFEISITIFISHFSPICFQPLFDVKCLKWHIFLLFLHICFSELWCAINLRFQAWKK